MDNRLKVKAASGLYFVGLQNNGLLTLSSIADLSDDVDLEWKALRFCSLPFKIGVLETGFIEAIS